MRQIGAFQPSRRDCAKLRDRRMSWIVSKGRAAVFLSNIEAEASVKSHELSEFQKVCAMIFKYFTILRLWERIKDYMNSQSRGIRYQCWKIVKFVKIKAQTFLICESKCDLTDVSPSIYDRKTAARPFDIIHDIIRSLSLVQYFSKAEMRQFGAYGR